MVPLILALPVLYVPSRCGIAIIQFKFIINKLQMNHFHIRAHRITAALSGSPIKPRNNAFNQSPCKQARHTHEIRRAICLRKCQSIVTFCEQLANYNRRIQKLPNTDTLCAHTEIITANIRASLLETQ